MTKYFICGIRQNSIEQIFTKCSTSRKATAIPSISAAGATHCSAAVRSWKARPSRGGVCNFASHFSCKRDKNRKRRCGTRTMMNGWRGNGTAKTGVLFRTYNYPQTQARSGNNYSFANFRERFGGKASVYAGFGRKWRQWWAAMREVWPA